MRVLAVGAHPDDVELGCAGTLARHAGAGDQVTMLVLTGGGGRPGGIARRAAEQEAAARVIGADLRWGGFPDGSITTDRPAVELLDALLAELRPDVVYGHAPSDTHQDHRAAATLLLAAARRLPRLLLFRGPSTDRFTAAVYVDVSATIDVKLDALRAHRSEILGNDRVDLEVVEAQARACGHDARVRFAEAFETPRFLWDPTSGRRPDHAAGLVGARSRS
jgi:LmbE family N-acetylglucosaminyl deacetylase